jgi:hypothetical protein
MCCAERMFRRPEFRHCAGPTVPPRDPNDDDDEGEEDDAERDDDEPAVIREPYEDE